MCYVPEVNCNGQAICRLRWYDSYWVARDLPLALVGPCLGTSMDSTPFSYPATTLSALTFLGRRMEREV